MRQAPVSGSGFWILAITILIFTSLLQGCASAPGVGPVTIVQSSLPNGRVNAAYSQMLTATGGASPYTWAIASGALPAGLTLNPTTGLLSGTPTQTTSMDLLTIRVSDSSSLPQSSVATLALTVVAAASITITPASLPNGQVGTPYGQTLVAAGGTAPYTWSLTSGTLPAGLSLNPASGAISGTPTVAINATPLTFKVTDASNPVITQSTTGLTLTIAPATLAITTASLPNGQVGTAYSQTLNASGGTTPYTWSLTSGTLPAGLVLNATTGVIGGMPTAAVLATPLTLKVTDSGNQTQSKSLTLTIASATLVITTSALPNGQVGVAYNTSLAATGGTIPYAWTITAGALPAGLALNAATGAITGTPTVSVSATPLTFNVTDAGSPPQTKPVSLTLTIVPATLAITTTSLPNGQQGVPYPAAGAMLAATGGTIPYTWTITAGTLPAGLILNPATGAITGTPTLPVSATPLTFKVTDSGVPAQTKTVNLTITIFPPGLAITTAGLPNGQVGTAYSTTLVASGGTVPYTWSITAGTLPAGLILNLVTGAITGTPTTPVFTTPLTVKVVDASVPQQTQSVNLTLTIAALPLAITSTSPLPTGLINTPYSMTLAATGGALPLAWSITAGALPTGLTLDPASGAITGTPTVAVTNTPITIKVTDSSVPALTQSAPFTLSIAAATLTITTVTLPDGQVGTAYNTTLAASGGIAPYGWTLMTGTLPAGLTLNAGTGAITGTPTAAITATPLTFKVLDSSSQKVAKTVSLTLTVAPPTLTITTTTLPDGQVGTAYSATLAATGGTTPYTWALTSGTLPNPLLLNAATGAITGTPTVAVTATPLTFRVTDSSTPTPVSKTVSLTLTIAPPTLTITTTTLPDGQVGTAYSATLAATGGTTPYTWTLTSGTLPNPLMLNPATGAITDTPTAAVAATPLTFRVTDSGTPTPQTKTVNVTLTIAATTFTVTVTPKRAGLTVSQGLMVTASTNDGAGVNWTATGGGGFSSGNSPSGTPVTYTAPGSAGTVTLTATNATDGTATATVTIGVTDASGITTYLNDNSRTGQNLSEHALTSAAGITQVNTTNFGKLFSCAVDAAVYPQPLWVANLSISGATHNVVFVATEHDTVYAFDADASPCTTLWTANLTDFSHTGDLLGETWVASSDVGGCGDLTPDIGIVGTPVIDMSSNTMYVVSKTKDLLGTIHQRIHALDITNGNERVSPPTEIAATVPGTGSGSSGGNVSFDPMTQNQRPALLLINGHVIISWASHCDNGPYHGWVMSYSASSLAQEAVLNLAPDGINAGVWMSGSGPAADGSGNIYLATGNGTFDVTNGSAPIDDYGDSIVKLGPPSGGTFPVASYFRSFRQQPSPDSAIDNDQGSGGVLLLPGGVLAQSGKDGNIYVANQSNLGGFSTTSNSALNQEIPGALPGGLWGSPTYWNGNVYFGPSGGPLLAFSFNAGTGMLSTTSTSNTGSTLSNVFPGPTTAISSNGSSSGIVWVLDNSQYCTNQSPGCRSTVLHAYDATNLSELWNSSGAGDHAGNAVKFTVPAVANGKVYVGTRTELTVYGLKPN